MFRPIHIVAFLTYFTFCASAQFDLEQEEIKLNQELLAFRSEFTSNGMDIASENFSAKMKVFLNQEGAFDYEFKHLETVAIIDSPDKKIRIINWNIEYPDFSYSYGGFVLVKRNKKVSIYSLTDALDPYEPKPTSKLSADEWYGALYYKIIPFQRSRKTEYLLLGWDGGTTGSNFKIIDVLTVSKKSIGFGSPVLNNNNKISNRIIFEYAERAQMTMRFEEKYGRIVMDHLSPEATSLEGLYSYYVPDLSYDAYIYDGDYWNLKEDVIAVNSQQESAKDFIQLNPRTGKLERKKIKNGWINPSNAINKGEIEHVARMPESPETAVPLINQPKDKKPKKKKRKSKKDPYGLSVTTGKHKIKKRKNR